MTTFSPREIVSELDRFIAKASGSEAVATTSLPMIGARTKGTWI